MTDDKSAATDPQPLQFRLSALLASMTVFAVILATSRRVGGSSAVGDVLLALLGFYGTFLACSTSSRTIFWFAVVLAVLAALLVAVKTVALR